MNIAPASHSDNEFDDARTGLDVARLIYAAGYYATARDIRHCGEVRTCRRRLCPTCKLTWKRRRRKRVLAAIKGTGADDIVCMVLTTIGDTAAEAIAQHREAWDRFLRMARFPVIVVLHLARKMAGGRWQWLAHHHLFVSARLVDAVTATWARVATRPANVEPIRTTLERAVAYAVNGAVKVPPCDTDAIDWIRALRGIGLVTVRKAPPALREETKPSRSTPKPSRSTPRGFPREANIRERILSYVSRKRPSESQLRKLAFASHERSTVDEVLARLVSEGLVLRVKTSRGFHLLPAPRDMFDFDWSILVDG